MRITLTPNVAAQVSESEARLRAELERYRAAEARTQQSPQPKSVPVVTHADLHENVERNSFELRFPGPIPKELSQRLKNNGWRYFFKDPKWYCHGRPEWQRKFAEQIVAEITGGNDASGTLCTPSSGPKPPSPAVTVAATANGDVVIGDLGQAVEDGVKLKTVPVALASLMGGDYLR